MAPKNKVSFEPNGRTPNGHAAATSLPSQEPQITSDPMQIWVFKWVKVLLAETFTRLLEFP
jgi:hypothetical protein